MPEEGCAQAPEFWHGGGGKELESGVGPSLLMDGPRERQELLQVIGDGMGRRLGGVHNANVRRRNAVQQRLQERIVGAAEDQRVGVVEAVSKSLTQVDTSDLFSDRMLDPSLFDQRDQQRTSLLPRVQTSLLKSFAIGVAADCGLGPDDNDFLILADRSGGL